MTTSTKTQQSKKITHVLTFDPDKARTLLTKRGMTVTGLAAVAGVSRVSASMWLSGATIPSYESLQRMAVALGLDTLDGITKRVKVKS